MVSPSRKPLCAHQLRPLNTPQPVRVETCGGIGPAALWTSGAGSERRRLRVAALRDQWRVDDLWWRRAVSRRYFQAVLEDGRCVTVYQDLLTQRWYRQQA